jgi:hypothetical protein
MSTELGAPEKLIEQLLAGMSKLAASDCTSR